MNIVLDEAFEEKPGGEKVAAGMVVSDIISALEAWFSRGTSVSLIRSPCF